MADGDHGMPETTSLWPARERTPLPDPEDLRDRFAMAALTGMLADSKVRGDVNEMARVSFIVADAMMKARQQ